MRREVKVKTIGTGIGIGKKERKIKEAENMTTKEVMDLAKKNKAVMVDLKFMDFPGLWQHFSVPIKEFSEDVFAGFERFGSRV